MDTEIKAENIQSNETVISKLLNKLVAKYYLILERSRNVLYDPEIFWNGLKGKEGFNRFFKLSLSVKTTPTKPKVTLPESSIPEPKQEPEPSAPEAAAHPKQEPESALKPKDRETECSSSKQKPDAAKQEPVMFEVRVETQTNAKANGTYTLSADSRKKLESRNGQIQKNRIKVKTITFENGDYRLQRRNAGAMRSYTTPSGKTSKRPSKVEFNLYYGKEIVPEKSWAEDLRYKKDQDLFSNLFSQRNFPSWVQLPLPVARRRMAARGFSSKKDSPVMTRLLELLL